MAKKETNKNICISGKGGADVSCNWDFTENGIC